MRWLLFPSPLVERLLLERTFCAIRDVGWHRLRMREAARPAGAPARG